MVHPRLQFLGPSECLPDNVQICSKIDQAFTEIDTEPVSVIHVSTSIISILSDFYLNIIILMN